MKENPDIAIIGAGAAGCFCAIELVRRNPFLKVTIYEAGHTPLAKVAVTGGGRCNFTNSFDGIRDIRQAYPRGAVLMKRLLREFGNDDVVEWFRAEGVEAVLQEDNCWFPVSQDAMQIVGTLTSLCNSLGVRILCDRKVERIALAPAGFPASAMSDVAVTVPAGGKEGVPTPPAGFVVRTADGCEHPHDIVIVTAGGGVHHCLDALGLETVPCVPSLFSLNVRDEGLNALMGTVVDRVRLSIVGEKLSAEGTLLLSHWGVSGPVTLNLSAYAAHLLARKAYRDTQISIDWLCINEQECREVLGTAAGRSGGKAIGKCRPPELTSRLWEYLLRRSSIDPETRFSQIGKAATGRLVNTLTCDRYDIAGKCKFQSGFVTSGGVSLSQIDFNTLEHRAIKGLYFAGEVLDIDAITGGFNLQAAWTTGNVVARSITGTS